MFIKKIRIRNFRSIVDETFEVGNLTIFVGKNDAGKSNILKALNLFFNGQTDHGQLFDFEADFSRLAKVGKNKAKEIVIDLFLSPPATFKDKNKIIHHVKKWRESGLCLPGPKVVYEDGSELTDRSRTGVWLNRLRYYYVPAIKGDNYFSSLLKQLYETLYETIKSDLQKAGQDFVEEIRKHTEPLSKELAARLKLDSKIQLPENLSELFATLDFETDSRGQIISLRHRGDGIKVRHLPVILQFLAQKERMHHSKGAVRSDTIWGYEEPENNLELTQAFALANDFEKYSSETQILLTTHSPAFYSIGKCQSNHAKHNVYVGAESSSSRITKIDALNMPEIDVEMGMLPLITPYIEDQVTKNAKLTDVINDLKDETKPVLFVEGPTDQEILENAWHFISGKKRMPFRIQIGYDRHFIGNEFLREDLFRKNPERVFIGMLDFDEAYENWKRLKDKENLWKSRETDISKGLLLKHLKYKAYIFLLPVPDTRKKYASESYGKKSALSIELLFQDDKLTDCCKKEETVGGSELLIVKDEKKVSFAKSSKDFLKDDFLSFEKIFALIESIMKEEVPSP